MTMTAGTRLGSFEIIGPLGAGGMGEVYRAKDTKLGREVAIKTLPSALAKDTDGLARFEREAQLLAALNHAHIASIYGLDTHEGTQFLAMELIEGETLEERLKAGPLPVEDALQLGLQIASALEAAHEKGVVHRDLKPANIMVTRDGVVKVLDFGLAKTFSGDPNDANPAHSPALSLAMTKAGMILGTAGYMSPEQASGQATDQRADIWAFGVVLYEMLTGLPLFSGESVPHILADVLRTQPDWDRLPKNLHPRVRSLLEHCLRKKPRNRYHSIADVRIEIEDVLNDPQGVMVPSATTAQAAVRGRRAWIGAFAVAALAAIGLSVPALQHFGETPAALPPETRVDIVTPPTTEPGSFALSPDGRRIAFVATDSDGETRLWLRDLATTTAQPLSGTEQASLPFWSPDERSIGFFAGSELKRLDLVGGGPQTLARVDIGSGGSWSPEDIIIFSAGPGRGLARVAAAGGEVDAVTTLGPEQRSHSHPQFLPDGRRFVFASAGTATGQGIYLGSLDDDSQTRLTSAGGAAVYSRAGSLFWIDDDNRLLEQPLDAENSMLTGQAVTVAAGVDAVSVSASGLLAYRAAAERRTQLQWRARDGELLGTAGDRGTESAVQPRISPDGQRMAFSRGGEIWVQDGNRTSQITFDGPRNSWPVWSPDGSRFVFGSQRNGALNLYETQSNGAGVVQHIFATVNQTIPTSWSPDGRFVLFFSIDPQSGNAQLGTVPMTGERIPQVLPTTPLAGGVHAVFSPDGRWLAFQTNTTGLQEVWLRPFVPPGTEAATVSGQWQVSTAGGIFPAWSADSRELFFLNPEGALMAVAVEASGDTPTLGDPQRLFDTRIVGGGIDRAQSRQYDVSSDGRFIINASIESEVAPITLLQNFDPAASR